MAFFEIWTNKFEATQAPQDGNDDVIVELPDTNVEGEVGSEGEFIPGDDFIIEEGNGEGDDNHGEESGEGESNEEPTEDPET